MDNLEVQKMIEGNIVEELRQLDLILEQIGGCGDGNCCIHRRPGMHTNGGCKCVYNTRDDQAQRRKVEKTIRNYQQTVWRIRAHLGMEKR